MKGDLPTPTGQQTANNLSYIGLSYNSTRSSDLTADVG